MTEEFHENNKTKEKNKDCTHCGLCCTKKICVLGSQVLDNNGLTCMVVAGEMMSTRCPFLMMKREEDLPPDEATAFCIIHYFLYNTTEPKDRKLLNEHCALTSEHCPISDRDSLALQNPRDDEECVYLPVHGKVMHPVRLAMACGAGHVHIAEIFAKHKEIVDAVGGEYEASKIIELEKRLKSECECEQCKKERGEDNASSSNTDEQD